MRRLSVIDSHTCGEPTRVVVSGFPELQGDTMAQLRDDFAARHDHWRTGIVLEPRGSDILVGALLTEPCDPTCDFGAIFFNNAGVLGMCGHGAMGLVETLRHMERIEVGDIRIDTPVGVVTARLQDDGEIAIRNVASKRFAKEVRLEVHGETVVGDVAYGGNWFFLVDDPMMEEPHPRIESLSFRTHVILRELKKGHVTGDGGAIIDHVELFGPSDSADSRNFVLCPGGAYDRSPCGTGTSAKMACLFEDGALKEDEVYRQESITGSVFEGWVEVDEGQIIPTIRGRAWVTGESNLLFSETDPLQWGYHP